MKKFLNVFLILLAIVALTSCFAVNEVTSIEFTTAPAASYQKDEVVRADSFSVVISFTSGSPLTLKLNDSRLTVTGLDGDKLDTKTHGLKTINISYQGFSVSVSYNVEGQFLSYWSNKANRSNTKSLTDLQHGINNAADLAQLAYLVNAGADTTGLLFTLAVDGNFDLSAHEWDPIKDFKGKFDGQNQTISGLRITDGSGDKDYANKGFFASTSGTVSISNLTFDEVFINSVSDGLGEKNKNYAAVVGNVLSGTTTIDKVTVQNSTIVGHGRVAALVGQTNSKVVITNSNSIENNFTAVNGYAAKSADGNGDKVGGLVGQAQSALEIANSLVEGVTVNGTRDLGGIVGYISATAKFINNEVKDSIIQASVPGGMTPNKGTRNIGVFVGTAGPGSTIELGIGAEKNKNTNSVTLVNANYGEISQTGELFGGIRNDSNSARILTIKIGTDSYKVTVTISEAIGTDARYEKLLTLAPSFAPFAKFLEDLANGVEPAPLMPSTTAGQMIHIELLP
jgi:hypothetical protein